MKCKREIFGVQSYLVVLHHQREVSGRFTVLFLCSYPSSVTDKVEMFFGETVIPVFEEGNWQAYQEVLRSSKSYLELETAELWELLHPEKVLMYWWIQRMWSVGVSRSIQTDFEGSHNRTAYIYGRRHKCLYFLACLSASIASEWYRGGTYLCMGDVSEISRKKARNCSQSECSNELAELLAQQVNPSRLSNTLCAGVFWRG